MKAILVVDDDPEVRTILVETLLDTGCVVLSAAEGAAALRLLADHHIDLLITDVRMPGISGFELALQAKLIHADLEVIYLSGYLGDTEAEAGRRLGMLLYKPIHHDELLREINHALGFDAAHCYR